MKKALFILSMLLVSACSYAPEANTPGSNIHCDPPGWVIEAAEVKRHNPADLCVIVEAEDAFYVFDAFGYKSVGFERMFIGGYDYMPLYLSLGLVALVALAIWGLVLLDNRYYKREQTKAETSRAQAAEWAERERYIKTAQEFASKE